ncbi:MAG: sugar transferase, partial [Solirubrobacteraceae bacterium]
MIRRGVDIIVSAAALTATSPLLAVLMVAIRAQSSGPALYRQRRVGHHGREFEMLKLRTMLQGAEHIGAGLAVDDGDPRITRLGAFLRRTSLDELPNLVNVLRG